MKNKISFIKDCEQLCENAVLECCMGVLFKEANQRNATKLKRGISSAIGRITGARPHVLVIFQGTTATAHIIDINGDEYTCTIREVIG